MTGSASAVEVTPPAVAQEAAAATQSATKPVEELAAPTVAPAAPAPKARSAEPTVNAAVTKTAATVTTAAATTKTDATVKAAATKTAATKTAATKAADDAASVGSNLVTPAASLVKRSTDQLAQAAGSSLAEGPLADTVADVGLAHLSESLNDVKEALAAPAPALELLRQELDRVAVITENIINRDTAALGETLRRPLPGPGASVSLPVSGAPSSGAANLPAAADALAVSPRAVEGVAVDAASLRALQVLRRDSIVRGRNAALPQSPAHPAPGSPFDAPLVAAVSAALSASGQLGGAAGFLTFLTLFGLFGSVLVRASAVRVIRPEGAKPPVSPA